MFGFLKPHLKPLQKPHPPIGVAGLSRNSDTLKMAGEHGFMPLKPQLNPAYVATHWAAVEEGAKRSGKDTMLRLAHGARSVRRRNR